MPRAPALNQNSTNDPNDGQLAGNAQTMLEIKVKSETRSIAALDNVAGFGSKGNKTGQEDLAVQWVYSAAN